METERGDARRDRLLWQEERERRKFMIMRGKSHRDTGVMERLGTCRRCGWCWSRAAASRLFSAARLYPAAFAAPIVSTARGGQLHFTGAASKYTDADETVGLAVCNP